MTTAARPTFDPARGGRGKGENDLSALSKQYSSRDLPSHTKLKYREPGQSSVEDVKGKDYRSELEEKERLTREKRSDKRSFTEHPSSAAPDKGSAHPSAITGSRRPPPQPDPSTSSKKPKLDQPTATPTTLDADDNIDDDDEDDEDSDDDDTAELLKELQKIKKERAEEQARKDKEKKEEEERIRKENLLKGNPLLNQDKGSFRVKKRWDDDVVFKNCAKTEQKEGQHFINDTIRSEFHRKFMDKYVK